MLNTKIREIFNPIPITPDIAKSIPRHINIYVIYMFDCLLKKDIHLLFD